ncbi:Spc97 / Spc98 family, partial [Geosmithia morbida]
GFFKPPQLDGSAALDQKPPSQETIDDNETRQGSEQNEADIEVETDMWLGLDDQPTDGGPPRVLTWDSFLQETTRPDSHTPLLLTEAGPAVYDALLRLDRDPLRLKNTDVPVIEAGAYFSSLLALALGQESMLFLRTGNDSHFPFRPALPSMRISGYSSNVLQGLEKHCLMCGTRLLELQAFVRQTYARQRSRCAVALASALDRVIQATREHVVLRRQRPSSLLQLQATVKDISAVLSPFHGLTSRLQRNHSDENVMSLVFDYASSLENNEEWLREVMHEVLRRVSQPWTESVEEWIGTRREQGVPLDKSNVGESKSFIKVEAEVYVDDFGEQVEDIDFRLDESKMPHFMPDDIAQTVFETGRSLRFIRTSHPEHPLARPDLIDMTKPPTADWLYSWDTILRLEKEASAYRDRLLDFIDSYRPTSAGPATSGKGTNTTGTVAQPDGPSLGIFSMDENAMEKHILQSIQQLNKPGPEAKSEDVLAHIIRRRLAGDIHLGQSGLGSRPHWSLLPVLSFGSIVTAQAHVVNRETLRQLFRSHDLRAHLRLQRDFQLFGNGLFVSRLSHALFDPDLERADRQTGVARQGGVMGLRLGTRDTWPPASSELRLALMGVLGESYEAAQTRPSTSASSAGCHSRDTADLPGDLSFAVRDMSEEEIEKCMNAASLQALDFLRLSYKTPPELASVLPPVILMQHDRVFKLLLRILRMIYVVNHLWGDVVRRGDDGDELPSYRFVREARHFVTNVASYFLDVGIALPWNAFEEKLDTIEASLDVRMAESPSSPEAVRQLHSDALQTIMSTLFLRKRQQPVLALLEDVFSTILDFARVTRLQRVGKATTEDEKDLDPARIYPRFKKKVQVFITVCRGLMEKGSGVGGNKGGGMGDESVVAQLLMKIDANGYYTKQIDHNFSKSHRIVTSSILPVVEQYGEHSRAIWEASKFWKQFFEASANVSLSGYEEGNNEGETTVGAGDESTAMRDDDDDDDDNDDNDGDNETGVHRTPGARSEVADRSGAAHDDESMLDEADIAGSTPRHPTGTAAATAADLDTPYETMKKEMRDEDKDGMPVPQDDDYDDNDDEQDSTILMAQRTAQLPDMSMTPRVGGGAGGTTTLKQSVHRSGNKDPLLHRVLDKNYRIQATPHKSASASAATRSPLKGKQVANRTPEAAASWRRHIDDSPMSSPEIAAPKLRSEAFMSPYKSMARQGQQPQQQQGPRTPGVSVQTPATARKTRDVFAAGSSAKAGAGDEVDIDWDIGEEVDDDDVDLYAGMSPPKTIQFALPPSRLIQTPAREASRKIVDDILLDAGADPESSEYSPTMVKMNDKLLDDTF